MKKHLCLWLVAALLLSGCGDFVAIVPEPMVHITYCATDGESMTADELEQCAAIMDYRLNAIAIPDYKISPDPATGTLLVDVPRSHYPGNLTKIAHHWCSRGELFICIDEDGGDPPLPPEGVVLDNSHIVTAEAISIDGGFAVKLTFTADGAEILSNTTKRLAATRGSLAIWMDWQIVSTPQVVQPITDGEALITDFASYESAGLFAAQINGGILPRAITASVDFSDAE